LLELGWYIEKVIVIYVKCERYEEKRCHVKENRGQGMISNREGWCVKDRNYSGNKETE